MHPDCGVALAALIRSSTLHSQSMQKVIFAVIIASLGWYAYGKYQARARAVAEGPTISSAVPLKSFGGPGSTAFRCDGRTHCSQMTSCEEATYFLKNCPGTKMDGDGDGVPCENQWCK